jgi:hypothetical protein
MADIRCPNCGKSNPDVLDVCQFCQTPLKPESVLRIGQSPTKKNTGELESVLPDWLKDMRQQARDSAEADAAAQAAAQSRSQKNEPPDLLAGLASQASSSEEADIPDWLASINPTAKSKPSAPSVSEPSTDFFAQFNRSEARPEALSEPPRTESPSWAGMGNQSSPTDKDELSDWFAQASEQPEETIEFDSDVESGDTSLGGFNVSSTAAEKTEPKEEEDLSWLHNLEAAAKQTGDLQAPKQEMDWKSNFEMPSTPSQPSSSQEDLSWLDNLGGIDKPLQQVPEQPSSSQNDLGWLDQFGGIDEPSQPSQPPSPQEDLSWLNNLGAVTESRNVDSAPEQPGASQPFASEEDLSWLNKLGGTSEASQPFEVTQEKPSSSEDLSWLNNLGGAPESSQPPAAQDDLSWLNTLGGESEPLSAPPFTEPAAEASSPRQTAPLGQRAEKDAEAEPDWLKSAIEPPSMPAPGDLSMDWFTGTEQPADEKPAPATPQSARSESDFFSTPSEPSSLSNDDVDSLFSVEMPDWLSHPEPGTSETVSQQAGVPLAGSDESLAPVDLPSWVQAMRPVAAVISETTPSVADQPTETEGPLAGLQGVIPIAPIGSSRRPKAVSLKLQASDEQQASAALLEQILGSETSPRTLVASSFVAPQQWLRWTLTGLFLIVLSAVMFIRSQSMPVSASLPVEAGNISNVVMNIPAGSKVLVVIDYEPSLAGEMEAISGPLLDQMILLTHPNLSFISTSPNGAVLVERLMGSTKINQPAPDGFGYQAGSQYLNLGYLPGGATGVLGFITSPGQISSLADVQSFSEYSALVILSDHAESGRVWVEQLQSRKQADPALTNQPLLIIASAQAGPLLQPYASSGQITGMISGISDAVRYEFVNNSRPGIVRSYWDTFGIGLMMSIALIIVGGFWSLLTGIRARRAGAKQG